MSLREYKKKRDFKKTPEPAGNGNAPSGPGLHYVIQKHDATRLHYDFRLELDGTLKSWAVPKGPSLDPAVKALAVHVEDHPLDYASFEGIIPEGEYGGGTVMVWDRGVWEPETEPRRAYRKGRLKFKLDGEKLHGSWALVRMGGAAGEDGKNWLLIKHRDEAAKSAKRYDVTKKEPLSVLSGRDLEEIAADADRVWGSNRKTGKKNAKKTAGSEVKNKPAKKAAKRTAKKKVGLKKNGAPRGAAVEASEIATIAGARKAAQPSDFSPQLAVLADAAPRGDQWLHELKFDGYRIVALMKNGRARLVSRNGKDWTRKFAAVAQAVEELPVMQAILDGEVVSLNEDGISSFQQLQNALKRGDEGELVYYLFDLPHCMGYDLTACQLLDRKRLLARIMTAHNPANGGTVRYSDHVQGAGDAVIEQACQSSMEGIVSKRADSVYSQSRSPAWLKVKCVKRQEFVIGGYTQPSGSRVGFGSLLLGHYDDGRLIYCGNVGTGFTHQSLVELTKTLKSLRIDASPFDGKLAASVRRGATWVRPELVGEVAFTEWTNDGHLRHPSFQGLREDKSPKKVRREEEKPMVRVAKAAAREAAPKKKRAAKSSAAKKQAGGRSGAGARRGEGMVAGVRITHPDRVLYPEQGLTKLDLALYYEQVAEWILPHVVARPLTLVRCPEGHEGECFYQKHLPHGIPAGLRGVMIKEKTKREEYVVVDDLAGLASLVQMGVLEIHPWPARDDNVEAPDRLIFDFDPGPGVQWKRVVEAARETRDRLGELGLESFLRTSGGKGLHVVAPLARRCTWDQLKSFAHAFADNMVRQAPERYIANMSKAKRKGKIFVDYLRNQRGATAVASYSTRARRGAPVAAPLTWGELTARLKPNQYTVENMPKRLARLKADPWEGFFSVKQSITRQMEDQLAP
jgi:bifunctional non-homologous end joining protein LigD